MKLVTGLIIGGAVLAVVFIATRPSSSSALSLAATKSAATANPFTAIGNVLGGILGAGGSSTKVVSAGASSSSSTNTTGNLNETGVTPDYLAGLNAAGGGSSDTSSETGVDDDFLAGLNAS